jgi:ribosomal protein S18 acetylase RimI-like enzyme
MPSIAHARLNPVAVQVKGHQDQRRLGNGLVEGTVMRQGGAASLAAHPLDNPAWSSLTGPHESFAEGSLTARRYRASVSPFAAIASEHDGEGWSELRALVAPGETVILFGSRPLASAPPAGWEVHVEGPGVQMVATDALLDRPDPDVTVLGPPDTDDMVDLAARTQPGPFTSGTRLLGTYLGFRRNGRLIAMAGERLHPDGWTEISAICTDPAARGQGIASRLIRAVAHGVRQRGETPFLHVAASNENAIRLYQTMGFESRRKITYSALRRRASS